MKKMFHILIIIVLLGFFTRPGTAHACGTSIEKTCCKTEKKATSEKKNCCKSDSSQTENRSCDGKCGHANCISTSSGFAFAVMQPLEFNLLSLDLFSQRNSFYHSQNSISAGFSSVWLIPKIG